MHRFLFPSSRSLLLSPTSRLIGSIFAGNLKARLLPFPKFAISNAFMSSSSAPDSDSSGFKEGSSDSKKTRKPRKPKKSSAAVPVVSLEATKKAGFSSTGTTVSAQQDEAAWSHKGMSKKEVMDQIVFLTKTLRKPAELESKKMELIEKPDKSENDIIVLGEVKEQLIKMKDFKEKYEAKYEAELRDLQEAIGSSTTAITRKVSKITPFSFEAKLKSLGDAALFSSHEVGTTWFNRKSLVETICNDLFESSVNKSMYCKGPFGSGKSTLLSLIGRELTKRGFTVFKLVASEVEERASELLNVLQEQSKFKTCVLLIDEASLVRYEASIWTKLFKMPKENEIKELRILGVGVPTIASASVQYSISKPISYLLMKRDSEDISEIIDFWVNFVVNSRAPPLEPVEISRDSVAEISNWVCDYTNGNMYLILSFCHVFFSKPDLRANVANYVDFFTSSEFFGMMEDKRHRCQLNGNTLPLTSYYDYLFNRERTSFQQSVSILSKLGYLDETSCKFFSDYVLCCFQNISRIPLVGNLPEWPVTYGVAEKRIIGGLRLMKETDFYAQIGHEMLELAPSVEDSISQRWSYYAIRDSYDVFVSPQNRTLSKKGRVDFLFNGKEKIAIEVDLNGTQQGYLQKLDLFLSAEGVYKQWRNSFAVFNIVTNSMTRKDISGIPKERLKYLFEFNVQTNTLYRGDMAEPLLVPVSSYLPTPPLPVNTRKPPSTVKTRKPPSPFNPKKK